ncbi:hypothetical protein AMS68_007380 [Peltaster fructicola]|uniref:Uncharacterized protein n=1 Tax=Peltaster fructicola TaxID=286661 RepID=A0A6H0Y4D3_9PEZI|nr:hypothetical protein AMS68_007380 [Peltaster fructicola]
MEHTDSSSVRENDEPDKKQKSRRPPNTAFRQQRLKAWQPILTPKTVLPLFFVVGVIFAPIGGALLYASAAVQELTIDYSQCQTSSVANCTTDGGNWTTVPSSSVTSYFKTALSADQAPQWCRTTTSVPYHNNFLHVQSNVCRLKFTIPSRLEAPVLLYYQLTNFYQNHRRYVKSFDQQQLAGTARDGSAINGSDCDPLKYDPITFKPYYPCGLIANSLFNDTYNSPVAQNAPGSSSGNTTYTMVQNGTAWSSDAQLYGNTSYSPSDVSPPPNWRTVYPYYDSNIPFKNLNTDEAFQVWMRTAGLPTFSKLALRNDTTAMDVGTYTMDIYDYYPVTLYGGTKSILLSTRTVMGGRNPFLGIAYVVVGGICILLGALFLATHLIRPRKLGDHNYLSWNTDQPTAATTTGRSARPGETDA